VRLGEAGVVRGGGARPGGYGLCEGADPSLDCFGALRLAMTVPCYKQGPVPDGAVIASPQGEAIQREGCFV
jgi:hypothetical protein